MPSPRNSVGESTSMFSGCPSDAFVCPFVRTDLVTTTYLANRSSNLDETYREYSIARTDDHIGFRRSLVKGQGHSKPSSWQSHPRRCHGFEAHLL